ncbi:MAG: hypothetical protein CMM50_01900 [Rhodospirillaceae bacterium]|nr:hypothetical protein [Rhodospirillaceae bacterium]
MLAAATGACMVLAATGCATPPDANDPDAVAEWEETNDPLEPMNRAIFDFNMALDEVLLKPLAKGYRFIFPQYVRDRIHDVLQNAGEPINFFNAVLQADSDRAATALGRLMLNSTFGLAGLYDLADYEFDIPVTDEDFGQTMATWGINDGPYLMLPLLGPSSVRDGLGRGADVLMNPLSWYFRNTDREWIGYTMMGVEGIDIRERNLETLDEIERTSLDFYAAIRSLYRQRRADLIANGVVTESNPFLE